MREVDVKLNPEGRWFISWPRSSGKNMKKVKNSGSRKTSRIYDLIVPPPMSVRSSGPKQLIEGSSSTEEIRMSSFSLEFLCIDIETLFHLLFWKVFSTPWCSVFSYSVIGIYLYGQKKGCYVHRHEVYVLSFNW